MGLGFGLKDDGIVGGMGGGGGPVSSPLFIALSLENFLVWKKENNSLERVWKKSKFVKMCTNPVSRFTVFSK